MIPNEETNSLQECFERLKKGCKTLSEECNYSENYSKFNPPATEEQIKDFESELKYPLPEAYREFLKFSNGARIMGEDIYGLDMIGMNDQYVPEGYLAISSIEMMSDRMAISLEDGDLYMLYDLKPSSWSFEREIKSLLNECESEIKSIKIQLENEKSDSETIKKKKQELDDYVKAMENFFAERNKK